MVGYDGVIPEAPEARTQPGLFLRVARVAGLSHDWRLLAQRSHANGALAGQIGVVGEIWEKTEKQ